MGKIKRFEDLDVWKKSRSLAKWLYELTNKFPNQEKHNLISQIRRAACSAPANIAEGFARYHYQKSIQFYRTARGSSAEIKSHLYVAFDWGYLDKKILSSLTTEIDEISKMLNGLINSTEKYRSIKQLASKL